MDSTDDDDIILGLRLFIADGHKRQLKSSKALAKSGNIDLFIFTNSVQILL